MNFARLSEQKWILLFQVYKNECCSLKILVAKKESKQNPILGVPHKTTHLENFRKFFLKDAINIYCWGLIKQHTEGPKANDKHRGKLQLAMVIIMITTKNI